MTDRLSSWLKGHAIGVYFVLAIAFSWAIYLLLVAVRQGWTTAAIPYAIHYFASFGPAILIAAHGALLFVLAWLLRKKPTVDGGDVLGTGLLWMVGLAPATGAPAGKTAVLFLNYALFVGFGEEILYRGYIQSRLNEAFGRPFRFYGVPFGWGILITNLLFGLMHVGVQRWILGINYDVTLAWGCWTIFSGLVFSFVREKTGSILAPALLHGLPQAIAAVALLFL